MQNTHGNPLSVSCHGHSWHGQGSAWRAVAWIEASTGSRPDLTQASSGGRLPRGRETSGLNCISISYQPPTWNCHCLIIHCLMPGTCDGAPTPGLHTGVDTVLGTEPHLVRRLWPEFVGASRENSPWQLYKHTRLTWLDEAEDKEGCCQGEEKLWVHDAVIVRGWSPRLAELGHPIGLTWGCFLAPLAVASTSQHRPARC